MGIGLRSGRWIWSLDKIRMVAVGGSEKPTNIWKLSANFTTRVNWQILSRLLEVMQHYYSHP